MKEKLKELILQYTLEVKKLENEMSKLPICLEWNVKNNLRIKFVDIISDLEEVLK